MPPYLGDIYIGTDGGHRRGQGERTFLKAGEQGLKTRAPGAVAQTEQKIEELENHNRRPIRRERNPEKSKGIVGELRGERILIMQGQLLEDGIRAGIRTICSVLEYNRSNVYFAQGRSQGRPDSPPAPWKMP